MTAQGQHIEDLLDEVTALRREVKLLRKFIVTVDVDFETWDELSPLCEVKDAVRRAFEKETS